MPIPFLNSINLTKNQVENFCIYNVANDPTGSLTVAGDYGYFWLNTTNSGGTIPTLKWWDGTNVRSLVDSTNIGSFTSGLATDLAGGGAGQIVYQDGANDTKFLAAGSVGQVLSSNGASAPSWLNQSNLSVGSATTATKATDVAGGAAGKLLYQTAVDDTDFLAVGTNGQVLTSSGTGPQWTNQSSLAAGTAANISGGLAGQLLYQSAIATTAKLTIGTAGQALVVNAGATAPQWVDQSSFSVGSATNKTGGTVGDILVQSGSGATSFLNVGTNGQVITSNGTSPQYVNQSTLSVGSATTSGTATNIAGGAANRIPYQTAAGTTAFITDAANSILTTNASSVPGLTASISVTVGKAVDIALGAAGDLLYQSASNDTSFLNIGANGQVLTSSGSAPQWSNQSSLSVGSATTAGSVTNALTAGSYLTSTGTFNGSAARTFAVDATDANTASKVVARDANGNFSAGTITATTVTGLSAPSAGSDAANRNYVDSVAQGLDVKASCLVATTGDITLSSPGAISIDNIPSTSFTSGTTRILVRAQSTASQNGIYIWNGPSSAMTRSADADTWDELVSAFTFIEKGDTLRDTGWVCTIDAGGTLGTTAVTWSQFSGAGSYTANRGLVLSGSAFNFAQNSDYAIGDLPYATGQTTIGLLPAVATGNALISGGVTTAPSWGKIGLTTHVSGTLPVGNGGTGASTFTAGRVLFGNGTSALNTSGNLFWDNTNSRLGIGTATPEQLLHLYGAAPRAIIENSANTGIYFRLKRPNKEYIVALDINNNGGNDFTIWDNTAAASRFSIASDGVCTWSNVGGVAGTAMTLNGTGLGIGTATISERLTVSGNVLATDSAGTYPRFISTVGAKSWEIGYRSGTTNYELREDGTTRLVVANGGNVGIGTATPAYKLDVLGAIASNNGTIKTGISYGSTGVIGTFSNHNLSIITNDATVATFTTSGNLGLGVTPATKLHIAGTGTQTLKIQTNTSGNPTLALEAAGVDGASMFFDRSGNYFGIGISGVATAVAIDTSGNLGIGTATPIPYASNARVLHIDGGANSSEIRLTNNITGTANTDGGLLTMSGSNLYVWNNENASVIFGTNNGTKATLDSSGNLGLGVTPNTWAAVFKAIQFPDGYAAIAGDNGNGVAEITSNAYNDGAWKFRNAQGAVRYRLDAINKTHTWFNTSTTPTANGAITWTPAMTLDASGNLALGTSTANFRADIQNASGAAVLRLKGGTGAAQGSAVYMTYAGGANTLLGIGDRATILGGTPDQLACIYSGVALTFEISGAERLRLKSTGQVNFVGLASDPAGAAGDVVYNSTSNRLKYHNGTAWVNTGTNKYSGALTGTGTSFTVTHNLGTRDVTVAVRKSGSTYDQVFTDVQMTDTNTVTIIFASSVTGSDYTVTVIG